jgi:hypothetical protein
LKSMNLSVGLLQESNEFECKDSGRSLSLTK